jgi:hypothetical protein
MGTLSPGVLWARASTTFSSSLSLSSPPLVELLLLSLFTFIGELGLADDQYMVFLV